MVMVGAVDAHHVPVGVEVIDGANPHVDAVCLPCEGHHVVLGTAGTGKSAIVIHRAARLADPVTQNAASEIYVATAPAQAAGRVSRVAVLDRSQEDARRATQACNHLRWLKGGGIWSAHRGFTRAPITQ